MQKSGILKSTVRGLFRTFNQSHRCLATSSQALSGSGKNKPEVKKSGIFSFFEPRKIQLQDASHSQRLSAKEEIIELQTHNVKPDKINAYLDAHKRLCQFYTANQTTGLKLGCVCVGNFNVFVGTQDQFIHIWRFESGYQTLDQGNLVLTNNPEYQALRKDILNTLSSRGNQFLMPFSYWPEVAMRSGMSDGRRHLYELRSYHLKPGTMVEWGNYWSKAIRLRDYKNTEAFLGTFSQIGNLYNVKHIWCYDSLADRQKARDVVWDKQQSMQWSDIVSNTLPLVKQMSSRIMYPLDYSPTQ